MLCPLKGTERPLVLLALLKKHLDTDSHRLTRAGRSEEFLSPPPGPALRAATSLSESHGKTRPINKHFPLICPARFPVRLGQGCWPEAVPAVATKALPIRVHPCRSVFSYSLRTASCSRTTASDSSPGFRNQINDATPRLSSWSDRELRIRF